MGKTFLNLSKASEPQNKSWKPKEKNKTRLKAFFCAVFMVWALCFAPFLSDISGIFAPREVSAGGEIIGWEGYHEYNADTKTLTFVLEVGSAQIDSVQEDIRNGKIGDIDHIKFRKSSGGNPVQVSTGFGSLNFKTIDFANAWLFKSKGLLSDCTDLESVSFEGVECSQNLRDFRYFFDNCKNLQTIDWGDLDLSRIVYADYMFSGCSRLTEVDLSVFPNSVTAAGMFKNCTSLTEVNISDLCDKGNDFSEMFSGCTNLKKVVMRNSAPSDDTGTYDFSNMFSGCPKLTNAIFELTAASDSIKVSNTEGMFNNCTSLTTASLAAFDTSECKSTKNMFNGCSNLQTITFANNISTAKVTDMSGMFKDCSKLTAVNVGNFDTSNVTDMNSMFKNCSTLTSLNVSGFDTSNVTDMSYMFYNCSGLTSLDTAPFDSNTTAEKMFMYYNTCVDITSGDCYTYDYTTCTLTLKGHVDTDAIRSFQEKSAVKTINAEPNTVFSTDISQIFENYKNCTTVNLTNVAMDEVVSANSMFKNCSSLTSVTWKNSDKGSIVRTSGMFEGCSSLKLIDISGFTGKLRANGMFKNCTSLTAIDLSGLKFANMESMFLDCTELVSVKTNNIDTSDNVSTSHLFDGCKSLISLDLSNFDTGNVTKMDSMFSGCESLISLNVTGFDTDNITDMSAMFNHCKSLASLDLSDFDTASVTNMYNMFNMCTSLTSLDLSSFNTNNVTNMSYMFVGLPVSPDLSCLDTSSVTDMSHMFSGIESDLDLSVLDTSNVTNMEGMFNSSGAPGTKLNLSGIDTSKVVNMEGMFNWAKYSRLDLSSFDTSNVTSMKWMFWGCSELIDLDVSSFDTRSVTTFQSMFHSCTSLKKLDLSNFYSDNFDGNFYCCTSLEELDISNLTLTGSSTNFFGYDTELRKLVIGDGFPKITYSFYLPYGTEGWIRDDGVKCQESAYIPNSTPYESLVLTNSGKHTYSRLPIIKLYYMTNGGEGTSFVEYANEDLPFTIRECEFTPPLYHKFDHWEINGSAYYPGDELSVTDEAVARAIWKAYEPEIITQPQNVSANLGDTVTFIVEAKYTQEYEWFIADKATNEIIPWSTYNIDDSKVHSDTLTFNLPEGMYDKKVFCSLRNGGIVVTTSRAYINIPVYSVTFSANGGSGTIASQTLYGTQDITLPKCTFTPPDNDHIFTHWNIGGKLFNEGDEYTVFADTVVKAVWGRKHIVQFLDNSNNELSYVYVGDGEELTMPEYTGTVTTGKQFEYWVHNKNPETPIYAGDKITVNEDMTFLSRFETIVYKVTFDTNGMGTAPAAQNIQYGKYAAYPATDRINGYVVSGWYTDKDCTEKFDFGTAIYDDITLYAKWEYTNNFTIQCKTVDQTVEIYYGDDLKVAGPRLNSATHFIAQLYYYDEEQGEEVYTLKSGTFDKLPVVFTADSEEYKTCISPEKPGTYLYCYCWRRNVGNIYYGKVYLTVKYKNGDLNKNGRLDEEDAAMLLKHLNGGTQLDEEQYARADVNGDGNKDMLDVIKILELVKTA